MIKLRKKMKKQTKMRALMLSLIMVLGMLVPMTMNAQNGGTDNFFQGSSDNYGNRDTNVNGSMTLGNATQEDPSSAPLGSGLLIMTAVGAGYALLKKKEA